jgi:surface polysaccharide O-acyltransferase-like enzyme
LRRNQAIEALRVLAAFGVVCFHNDGPMRSVAYAGLSIFIILTMHFETGLNYDRHVRVSVLAKRLLVPWCFWFVAFAGLNVALGQPALVNDANLVEVVFTGSSLHLWYLPFIFLAVVVVSVSKQNVSRLTLLLWSTAGSLVVFLLVPIWRPWSLGVGPPVAQYLHALTPLLFGVVIGTRQSHPMGRLALLTVLVAATVLAAMPYRGVALPHLIAGLLVLTALHLKSQPPAWLRAEGISRYMLGVYLIHPAVLTIMHPAFGTGSLLVAVIAFVGSLALTAGLDAGQRVLLPGTASVLGVTHSHRPAVTFERTV